MSISVVILVVLLTTSTTLCQSSTYSSKTSPKNTKEVFDLSVQLAMSHCHSVRGIAIQSHRHVQLDKPSAMDDCLELLDSSLKQLNLCRFESDPQDIDTWLSAAMTNLETCKESLKEAGVVKSVGPMWSQLEKLNQYISNALALHQTVKGEKKKTTTGKKPKNHTGGSRYPAWMKVADRKLLEASPEEVRADAVVAMDGSGTHRTIGEALAFVASMAGRRVKIYIKAGTYKEYINIPREQNNVMLMGDGKGKSVIVGSRSNGSGYSTYNSATVAAIGDDFIAKGLSIINNAGPQNQQAVALLVRGDRSVIYQCSIEGYQDTLYTHSQRQFYRDSDIYGTVDFIFGNAVAVIQNCNIHPRKPKAGQSNTITAQGRNEKNGKTGLVIHNCRVEGSSDLGNTPTYLGRPWKLFSRTIFMGTYLDGSINTAGWLEWFGDFALSTLYYGEYNNTGPGSPITGRVKWPGVHSSLSISEASMFTVNKFIFGDEWLPDTGINYTPGL